MGKIIRNLLRGVGGAMEIAPVVIMFDAGFSDDATAFDPTGGGWDDMRKALEKSTGSRQTTAKLKTR